MASLPSPLGSLPNKPLHVWTEVDVITAICSVPVLCQNGLARKRIEMAVHRNGVNGAMLSSGNVPSVILDQMLSTKLQKVKMQAEVNKWRKQLGNVICVRSSQANSIVLSSDGADGSPAINLRTPLSVIKRYVVALWRIRNPGQIALMDSHGRHLVETLNLTENQLKWGSEIFVDLSPKDIPDDMKISTAPDVITHEDGSECRRAAMRCSHAISAQSMTLHIQDSLRRYQFEVYCPDSRCKAKWDWELCKRVACLNGREEREFEQKRQANETSTLVTEKSCPACGNLIFRNLNLGHSRVRCPICNNRDICWRCLKPWTAGGFGSCGNADCDTVLLQTCETHDMDANKNVPVLRSCPRCEALVEHAAACKHIHCARCSYQFCMVCLKTPAGGGWPCGSYCNACPGGTAPRQQV